MTSLPPILGFCGRAGAGKSSAALQLVADFPQVHRLSFADPLRQMLLALGLSPADLSAGKETPHPLLGGKTPRMAMQTLGTEWGRGLIDPGLWLNAAKARAHRVLDDGGVPVFDDVRFDNEARMIRHLGGLVIGVVRPGQPQLAPAHASEAGISPDLVDYTIRATDIPGLRLELHRMLNRENPYALEELSRAVATLDLPAA